MAGTGGAAGELAHVTGGLRKPYIVPDEASASVRFWVHGYGLSRPGRAGGRAAESCMPECRRRVVARSDAVG
jgi:hypothetical protein